LAAGSEDTLSRGNLISEFLRNQKVSMKDMTQEEFLLRYEAYVKEMENNRSSSNTNGNDGTAGKLSKSGVLMNKPKTAGNDGEEKGEGGKSSTKRNNLRNSFYNSEGNFKTIVLKFTTLSEGCTEAPSFTVDRNGAKIGREKGNDIAIPSDARLAVEGHSMIEYHRGAFYLVDGGYNYSASVRIGIGNNGNNTKKWWMDKDSRFCAGNSVFQSKGMNADGLLEVLVIEGPLKGETIIVPRKGATLGRSSENGLCVPDRELSRKHSKIEYDDKLDRYFVSDLGSTNGTYIQLVGPYGGRYKLHLNDHILVGRTGFSINRFDYGLSEEMGYRQSMEDACTIVQHLNIGPLCVPDLSPQSFFGVFDGHGGVHASHYLAQHLHVNVAHGLLDASNDIFHILDEIAPESIYDSSLALSQLDKIVTTSLKSSFLKTDQDFINTSTNPQNGSTATSALVLGRRLYCANCGDSRTMLCRLTSISDCCFCFFLLRLLLLS
jgi:pSer/pThr/pTyr-binding forkhead associated (FHA) protein